MPAIENPPIIDTAAAETASGPVRATRFDPPHEIPRAAEAPAATDPAPGSDSASATKPATNSAAALANALAQLPVESPTSHDATLSAEAITPTLVRQFRTQAQQLASHLEARQRELDHRESELHSQLARHEADARSARLWFQEQHRKLTQRQAEWERREREINGRMRSLHGPSGAHTDRDFSGSVDTPDASIDDEIEFRLREAEFHELSAQLEARYHSTGSTEKKLEIRQQQLEAAEARLARGEAELHFAKQEFQAEREAQAARAETQRRQAADDRARHEAELAARRAELADLATKLEQKAAAIDQLRADLLLTQRDTLESQLAAEELRAELAGKAPPATLVESMSRLRSKLAAQYRLQREELERQQAAIAAQTDALAAQQRQLASKQHEFEAWMADQHRQIAQAAAQLADREQQLERQHVERESRRLQWESQRRELELEIRQLQAHIRRLEENALS